MKSKIKKLLAELNSMAPDTSKMGFGDYPKEYDKKIHGSYDPARYYGKPGISLFDVKLGEVQSWAKSQDYSPRVVMGVLSRAWWRWQHKYMQPKRAGLAPFLQIMFGTMTIAYIVNYGNIKHHKNYKHH